MSSSEVVENKISFINQHLNQAKGYQKYNLDDLKNNNMLKSAVERELYILAQAVIDLAEAIIALKNLRKPTTMREALDILGEENILPREFINKFHGIVGFRNALAHAYEDLKMEIVYDVLQNKLSEIKEFLGYIKKNLN